MKRNQRLVASDLLQLKDDLARKTFGYTPAEAIGKGVCIKCGGFPAYSTEAGRREYFISALCEPCFDEITGGVDEKEL